MAKKFLATFALFAVSMSMFLQVASAQNTGTLALTDASGVSQLAFESGDRVYLSVTDADRNTSGSADTLTVRISSDTENTGTPASATAPNSSGNTGTGTLTVSGVGLNTRTENWTVTAISATEFVISGSVSGAQSRNLLTTDTTYSTDNDEVSLALTVGNFAFTAGDRFTFSTTAAVIVAETLTLTETGNTTGVFTGSITLSEVTNPVANNGVLEIQPGNQITAFYDDPSGDFNASDQVRTQALYAATIIPGTTLLSNTTWTKTNSPYLLTGDLIVESGVSLIIDPGVTVLFLANSDSTSSGNYSQDSELIINGNLVARGTSSERITFASSSTSPAAGDWGEIRLNGMGVNFEYVDIKHANRGINAHNQADGDTLRIANSRFTLNNSALYHYAQGTGAQVVVRDNTFTNTTNTVIEGYSRYSSNSPQWQVVDNTVNGFNSYGMLVRSGALEVTGNSFTTTQIYRGLKLEASGGATVISNNTVSVNNQSSSNCSGWCIEYAALSYVGNATALTITNNDITGANYGLFISVPSTSTTTTISNNSVRGTTQHGVYIVNYNNDNLTVQNNTAEDNNGTGITLEGQFSTFSGNIMRRNQNGLELRPHANNQTITITDNIISDNTDSGITLENANSSGYDDVTITVTNNDLSGNGNYAIYNNKPYDIDARQNWWGTNETAAIQSGSNPKQLSFIYDGQDSGNTSAGTVSYAGWLSASPTTFLVRAYSSPEIGGSVTCSPSEADLRGISICRANATAGYLFDRWSGACGSEISSTCTLQQIDGTRTSTAFFVTTPSAPRINRSDYGDAEIMLWVTVPDNGGATVTQYHATCSDGKKEFTAQSARSQITVTGLTNDTPYTCTVSAENRVGVSEPSEATPAITPEAMSGLPVWLLYEAARAR